ncbi:MAG: hypothetical protein HOW97_08305, partial [Catenulispora sp.]|nr:hypothetical protein [Catenulispora sp.]
MDQQPGRQLPARQGQGRPPTAEELSRMGQQGPGQGPGWQGEPGGPPQGPQPGAPQEYYDEQPSVVRPFVRQVEE